MAKISIIELEKLRQKQSSPDQAIELSKQASQQLANFKTRITNIFDELTALRSGMRVEDGFTKAQYEEVSVNLAEIEAVKITVDALDL